MALQKQCMKSSSHKYWKRIGRIPRVLGRLENLRILQEKYTIDAVSAVVDMYENGLPPSLDIHFRGDMMTILREGMALLRSSPRPPAPKGQRIF